MYISRKVILKISKNYAKQRTWDAIEEKNKGQLEEIYEQIMAAADEGDFFVNIDLIENTYSDDVWTILERKEFSVTFNYKYKNNISNEFLQDVASREEKLLIGVTINWS